VIAAITLSGGHLLWLVFPVLFLSFVVRPRVWGGPRYGRGFGACGPRYTTRTGPEGER
jgi:hypothetical protein